MEEPRDHPQPPELVKAPLTVAAVVPLLGFGSVLVSLGMGWASLRASVKNNYDVSISNRAAIVELQEKIAAGAATSYQVQYLAVAVDRQQAQLESLKEAMVALRLQVGGVERQIKDLPARMP